MPTDLHMLAWTAALTVVLWLPYIATRIAISGIVPALSYRPGLAPLPAWAQRAKGAHDNAVANLAPFAALVIVAYLTGAANEATATAAIVYFWARVAHAVVYIAGIPYARTLCFAAGVAATLSIAYQILAVAA